MMFLVFLLSLDCSGKQALGVELLLEGAFYYLLIAARKLCAPLPDTELKPFLLSLDCSASGLRSRAVLALALSTIS